MHSNNASYIDAGSEKHAYRRRYRYVVDIIEYLCFVNQITDQTFQQIKILKISEGGARRVSDDPSSAGYCLRTTIYMVFLTRKESERVSDVLNIIHSVYAVLCKYLRST